MITQSDLEKIYSADVYTTDGEKIGSTSQVYLDDRSGAPEWVAVKTGLFGTKQSFVPLDRATLTGDRLVVPFGKDQVKDAPQIDEDGDLSPAEEDTLYTHYGMASTDGRLDGGDTTEVAAADGVAAPSGDAMTRSEERLVAGTRNEQVGKARLRKHVVTEQQQVTVPVTHEEVTLEREPITDANIGDALDGPGIAEDEHEVVLHAERPVVNTETVPVERVKLGKKTVTEDQTVGGEVRKEQIEFDGNDGTQDGGRSGR
jgi:uncharacterized protein (TIGR02271 family)